MLEDFRKYYSQDPCLDLLLIDYYTLKKDYAQAIPCVDRLDKSVGGDPYLNVLRAASTSAAGHLNEACRGLPYAASRKSPR